MARKFTDLAGKVFNRWTVESLSGRNQKGDIVWNCVCTCGTKSEVRGYCLTTGHSKSCGCLKNELIGALNKSHGMTGTKEHNAWRGIVDRVTCETDPGFGTYSLLGMEEGYKNSFEEFLKEIGMCPGKGRNWSVGRIDNSKGYIVGNIQWETANQQARNKGKSKVNKSGVTGVSIRKKQGKSIGALAFWTDLLGKPCSKYFSFSKYGEELAFLAAREARDQATRLLNQQGAGYAPSHGK